MAIPGIPGPILPLQLRYSVSNLLRWRLRREKGADKNNDSASETINKDKKGRFDMGYYLHLMDPKKLSIPPGFTTDLKNHLKAVRPDLTPYVSKLKALYIRLSPSRSSKYTSAQNSAANDIPPKVNLDLRQRITTLPVPIFIRIVQSLPIPGLLPLLRVNKHFRSLVLENYHQILGYPHIITSKYEFCPLELPFPKWWTEQHGQTSRLSQFFEAWWRVRMYEGCYIVLAEVLTDGYLAYWKIAATRNPRLAEAYEDVLKIGWDTLNALILAELVKETLRRGVAERVEIHLQNLVPENFRDSIRAEAKGKEKATESHEMDEDPAFGQLNAGVSQIMGYSRGILNQALKYVVHKTIHEDINYSFPGVKLERLHPVQILELMRIEVPPWSWSQEDQVERFRRVFILSYESIRDINKYRMQWEAMKEAVAGVIRVGLL